MRKEVFYFIDGVRGDYFQYILKPFKRVNPVKFTSSQKRVQHSAMLSSFMTPGEQVIFPADLM
jgi:hypothetical protein